MTNHPNRNRRFYATFDRRANLHEGNQGFANTIEVCRFRNREDRDAFVERERNRMAEPVTREQAARAFAGTYSSVGESVPRGGLFGNAVEWVDLIDVPGQTASRRF